MPFEWGIDNQTKITGKMAKTIMTTTATMLL